MLHNAFLVDDEQGAICHTLWTEDTISFGQLTVKVGHQGVLQTTETSFITGHLDPGQMRKFTIHRNSQDLGIPGLELIKAI
eukprot:Skav236234  [mRNA]  locus=scaffold829:74670:74912:- [translate_table: standard]